MASYSLALAEHLAYSANNYRSLTEDIGHFVCLERLRVKLSVHPPSVDLISDCLSSVTCIRLQIYGREPYRYCLSVLATRLYSPVTATIAFQKHIHHGQHV